MSLKDDNMQNRLIKYKGKSKDISGFFGNLAAFTILCVYPLFILNGYHNITAAKQIFFSLSAAIFSFLCLFFHYLTCSNEKLTTVPKLSPADISMLLFLFVAIFSCISSEWKLAALSGVSARKVGFITTAAMVMGYFVISKFYRIRRIEFFLLGLVVVFMCVFSIAQYVGFDPLGFLSTVAQKFKRIFIGFSGNVNMYAALLTLFIPLFMTLFCFEEKISLSIAWFIFALTAMCGMLASNSDGAIVGIGVAFAVLLGVCFKSKKALVRCFIMFDALFLSFLIFKILRIIFESKAREANVSYLVLLNPKLFVPGLVFFTLLAVAAGLINISEENLLKIRKIYVIGVLCVAALAAFAFFYFSVINKDVEIGKIAKYFRFNDNWGSKRGYAWKKAIRLYRQAPLTKKLIGYGEDTVALAFYSTYGKKTFNDIGLIFDNVHNYFLQFLITMGAWGLVTYTASLVYSLKSSFRESSYIKIAVAVAICAYIAQSTVNITQPISTPMFFIFLGLSQSKVKS